MKNYFPSQNGKYTYIQTNRSDSAGSIWSSMGLDFQSDLGTLRIAPRLKVNTSTANDASLGLPIAFEYADQNIWAICGSTIFKNGSSPNAPFVKDTSTGNVTTYNTTSDLETFNNLLWSTAANVLYSKVMNGLGTGTWTSRDAGLSTGSDHMLKYFRKFNRLYYQQTAGFVTSIDTSNVIATTDYSLTLGAASVVTCMESASNSLWLGVSAVSFAFGLHAIILNWDGFSAQATNEYTLKSPFVLSMTALNDIPYVMDGNGVLSKYTGYTFEEVGRLPFTTILPLSNYIARNGMISTKNDTILVAIDNLNGDNAGTIYENIPSGIWEWSKDFGFTHKYPITYNPSANSTITDYGQNRIAGIGALFGVEYVGHNVSGANGTLVLGASYYTDASNTTNAILFDDSDNTVQKKGYFVTTWFFSSEVEDKWTRLWDQFKKLPDPNDSIVFKYQLNDEDPTYATITWLNTTSFTTMTDITAFGPTAPGFNGTSGGEVEIIQGTGSASCAHITNIVNNAGTYTVTLDDPITGVTTGTAKARFAKWIKVFPEVNTQTKSWEQQAIGANDIRIRIKGCMTFTGNGEFYKLAIFSNEDIKINP